MPQRFLRPGITNSERWNSVSFACQSFYIRILTHVDDYGRFDGRPAVLHGHCFSVWNERNPKKEVTLQQVDAMLQQLAEAGLLEWYEVDGKKVVQFVQWQERIRENTKSKWPERTGVAASCCKLLLPSPSPTPPPTPSPYHLRLGKLFRRKEETRWSEKEEKALKAISPIAEYDLDLLEKYYTARHPADADYRRRDLLTLLNNWHGEVDRARNFKPKKEYNL